MYCSNFKDLVYKIEDYISENFEDDSDYEYIVNELKRIEKEYNSSHQDQYTILFDLNEGLDILPNNYIAYKIINDNTDNSLTKWGFEWSSDMNKLIFIPACFNEEDKIKFLINLIKKLYPQSETYFEKYWKEYLNEDKKWIC